MAWRAIAWMAPMAVAAFALGPAFAQAQAATPLPSTWMADARTGCKVWDPQPEPGETVTWSGACSGGFASGPGVTVWIENGVPDERAEGPRVAGHLTGQGTQTSANGDRYVGEWKDDRKNGHGVFTGANGTRYEGDFNDDRFDGFGTLSDGAGNTYAGQWKDGRRNGRGKATFRDGAQYDGLWVNDQPIGKGDPA